MYIYLLELQSVNACFVCFANLFNQLWSHQIGAGACYHLTESFEKRCSATGSDCVAASLRTGLFIDCFILSRRSEFSDVSFSISSLAVRSASLSELVVSAAVCEVTNGDQK